MQRRLSFITCKRKNLVQNPKCQTNEYSEEEFSKDNETILSSSSMDEQFESKIGDFKILSSIGEGATSSVYLAIHIETKKYVALKRMRKADFEESVIEKFRREIKISSLIDHPGVVHFYDYFETQEALFIVLEFIEGKTLSSIIEENGRLPEDLAIKYFLELVSILKYLHDNIRVVHRDLKTDNIIVDQEGHLHLIDFGLSNLGDANMQNDNKLFNTACGTIAYSAPELFKHKKHGWKVDIWSSGVILYSMLCGSLPFCNENIQRLLNMIVNNEPEYPDYLSENVINLLTQLLQKSPKKRIEENEIFNHPAVLKIYHENSKYLINLINPTADMMINSKVASLVLPMTHLDISQTQFPRKSIVHRINNCYKIYHNSKQCNQADSKVQTGMLIHRKIFPKPIKHAHKNRISYVFSRDVSKNNLISKVSPSRMSFM